MPLDLAQLPPDEGVSSLFVLRVAIDLMSALWLTDPALRAVPPSASQASAKQTVESLTSRVLPEPSACFPTRPPVYSLRTGDQVPCSSGQRVAAPACSGSTISRSFSVVSRPGASA